jgi:hypothetical protein
MFAPNLGVIGAGVVGLTTVTAIGLGVFLNSAPKEHAINPPENPSLTAYGAAILNGKKIAPTEVQSAMLTALNEADNVAISNYAFKVTTFAQTEISKNKNSPCFRKNRICVYDDMLKAITPRLEAALNANDAREVAALSMQVKAIDAAYNGRITPISPKPAVLGLVLSEYRKTTANRHNSAVEVAADSLAKVEQK